MLLRCIKYILLSSCVLTTACSTSPDKTVFSSPAAPAFTVPLDIEHEFQQAVSLMKNEHWQSAAEKLEAITTQQPGLSGPWLNLGIAYTMRGNSEAAEHAFKTAIDTNAKNTRAYNQLGVLYRRDRRYDDAQFIYESALQIDPDNTDIHWNLAILYDLYLQNPRRALQHYQRFQVLTASDDRLLKSWITELAKRTQTDNITAKVKP